MHVGIVARRDDLRAAAHASVVADGRTRRQVAPPTNVRLSRAEEESARRGDLPARPAVGDDGGVGGRP